MSVPYRKWAEEWGSPPDRGAFYERTAVCHVCRATSGLRLVGDSFECSGSHLGPTGMLPRRV